MASELTTEEQERFERWLGSKGGEGKTIPEKARGLVQILVDDNYLEIEDILDIRVETETTLPAKWVELWRERGYIVDPKGICNLELEGGNYTYPLHLTRRP